MFNWIKRKKWLLLNAVLVAVLVSLLGIQVMPASDALDRSVKIGIGNEKVITLGHIAYAAGSVDYMYDGIDDDVQFQAALDALPATGGRLVDVSAVQKNFSATVTRAIDNVTISGSGQGSYFVNDGGTALFTAGGNNWKLSDIRTDAGGITMGVTTGWQWINVNDGSGTVYDLRTPAGSIVNGAFTASSVTDSGLTSGRIPYAGVGGLLGDSSNLTFDGSSLQVGGANVTRSATYVVAASDAPAHVKAQADYAGDGVDDQVQIQAAIDALTAGGGIILLDGNYSTRASIVLSSNITISGQGDGTVLKPVDEALSLLTVNGTSGQPDITVADASGFAVGMDCIVVDDAHLDGNAGSYRIQSIAGNTITFTTNLSVTYTVANNAYIVNAFPVFKNWVTGQSIYSGNVSGVILADLKVDGNNAGIGTHSWQNQAVISVFGLTKSTIRNVTIENASHAAISIQGVNDGADPRTDAYVTVFDCNIIDPAGRGVDLGTVIKHVYIVDSKIYSATQAIFFCSYVEYSTILGNLIDSSGNGVYFGTAHQYLTVVGNTFRNNTMAMNVHDVSYSIITNNLIQGGTDGIMLYDGGGYNLFENDYLVDQTRYGIKEYAPPSGNHTANVYRGNIFENIGSTVMTVSNIISQQLSWDKHSEVFMDVLAASANHVGSWAGTGALQEITAGITQTDVPRNLSVNCTNVDTPSGIVIIEGRGAKGDYLRSESLTLVPGGVVTGNEAFSQITKITIPASVTAADTVSIGIGSKLGLANLSFYVYKVKKNNADYPAASYTYSNPYDTVDVSAGGAITGGDDFTIWYVSRGNSIIGE